MMAVRNFVNAGDVQEKLLTKHVRTKKLLTAMKPHRQGRTGAREQALRRAHAHRLLMTLAGICRELRWAQSDEVVCAAYLEVEQHLMKLVQQSQKEKWTCTPPIKLR
ncbi:hypothetical protein [Opitutus sp. GAS368]|jgi:hypothetical protein|uniref:hypothetical protein n=1 Tax=Opitutus sp. GAS368 TaxID=1882749 RepID=UPI00087AC18B|nr:hypothetical protein [Opitutus sp. GAS368]SDR91980.1 hypothetical protein SAMN05444173_1329 [Opitutus sp. GAS368]